MTENNYIQFTGRLKATSQEGILAEAQQIAISGSDNTNVKEYIDNRTKTVEGFCNSLNDWMYTVADILAHEYDNQYDDLVDRTDSLLYNLLDKYTYPDIDVEEDYSAREYVEEQIKEEDSIFTANPEDLTDDKNGQLWREWENIEYANIIYFPQTTEFLLLIFNKDRKAYRYRILNEENYYTVWYNDDELQLRSKFYKYLIDKMGYEGLILCRYINGEEFVPTRFYSGHDRWVRAVDFDYDYDGTYPRNLYINETKFLKDIYNKVNKLTEKLTMS